MGTRASSIIEGVIQFFMNCPLLKDGTFRLDSLTSEPIEYAITTGVFNPVLYEYTNGDSMRQFQFSFTSREYYSMDRIQNVDNTEFYEEFAAWVEEMDRLDVYPEMPPGCYPQSMTVDTPGYIFDTTMRNARYQIQITIEYYKEVAK